MFARCFAGRSRTHACFNKGEPRVLSKAPSVRRVDHADVFDRNHRPGTGGVLRPPGARIDITITGAIKLDFSSEKHDKWLVSSIKCDDVTVVATGERGIVATTKGNSVPGDPASCVYSMKVPSGVALSVYAQIGSAQSVGITSLDKLKKSDLLAQKLGPTNTIKGDSQFLKIKLSDSTNTLPLYLKLDT
jgi:hypothetical protein